MAAARGDPRRRPGSVFTVQPTSNCGPGPCRDGLNSGCNSTYGRSFTREEYPYNYARHPLGSAISRDGSKDVLAEVRVQTPISDTTNTSPVHGQVSIIHSTFQANKSSENLRRRGVIRHLPYAKWQQKETHVLLFKLITVRIVKESN
ncbi:putative cyclic nucleotide-gated ion channel [Trypoxylus dichotomus]